MDTIPGFIQRSEADGSEELRKVSAAYDDLKKRRKGCGSSRFGGIGGLLWNSKAKNKDGTQRGIAGG